MNARHGLVVAAVSTLALSLGGCVFAIRSTPDDDDGPEKRMKALEQRIERLEKKCAECSEGGECEIEGMDAEMLKGMMKGGKVRVRTIVIKGDGGEGVFELPVDDDEKKPDMKNGVRTK